MNGMKRILFLTLLSCVGLCTHVMAEEKKGDLDKEEERSISHDPVKVEMSESMLTLHFMRSLGEVSIWIVDDRGTLGGISAGGKPYQGKDKRSVFG